MNIQKKNIKHAKNRVIYKESVQREILNYNEMSFVFFNCNDKSSTFIVHKETVIWNLCYYNYK